MLGKCNAGLQDVTYGFKNKPYLQEENKCKKSQKVVSLYPKLFTRVSIPDWFIGLLPCWEKFQKVEGKYYIKT